LCDFLINNNLSNIIFKNKKLTEYLKNNKKYDNLFWDKKMIGSIINIALKQNS